MGAAPGGDPLKVLAFSPHPDDAELFCGGTLAASEGIHRLAQVTNGVFPAAKLNLLVLATRTGLINVKRHDLYFH